MRRGPWSRPPASWLVDPYLGAVNGMDLRRSYLPRYMELITILNFRVLGWSCGETDSEPIQTKGLH